MLELVNLLVQLAKFHFQHHAHITKNYRKFMIKIFIGIFLSYLGELQLQSIKIFLVFNL